VEGAVSLFVGELGPHLTQCRLGQGRFPYQVVYSCIQPFGHNRHWPKAEDCCAPLGGGRLVFIKHNVALAESYLHTKWHLDPSGRLATIDMRRKRGCCAPFGRGAGSPSNTMWPVPRPTSVPNGILIHKTVWSNTPMSQTDRQTE